MEYGKLKKDHAAHHGILVIMAVPVPTVCRVQIRRTFYRQDIAIVDLCTRISLDDKATYNQALLRHALRIAAVLLPSTSYTPAEPCIHRTRTPGAIKSSAPHIDNRGRPPCGLLSLLAPGYQLLDTNANCPHTRLGKLTIESVFPVVLRPCPRRDLAMKDIDTICHPVPPDILTIMGVFLRSSAHATAEAWQ